MEKIVYHHAVLTVLVQTKEMRVDYRLHITDPKMGGSPGAHHYHELTAQAVAARNRGDHWTAQKYESAAHKWMVQEQKRIQQLADACESLAAATQQLEAAWDKDRECTTISELRERHPKFKHVISAWERAQQLVRDLDEPQPTDDKDLRVANPAASE